MKNDYSLYETFRNVISLIYTKLFYKGARLIRFPIFIRGKKYLKYGKGFTTGYCCRLEMFNIKWDSKKLIIGENCKIGDYVHIAAGQNVTIGNNVLMASKIYISDISHGEYSAESIATSPDIPPDKRPLFTKPVFIGNNVWIGEGVSVLPGSFIGDGSIIGANSVVNKKIPENSIAVGSPARVVKKYNNELKTWMKVTK